VEYYSCLLECAEVFAVQIIVVGLLWPVTAHLLERHPAEEDGIRS
jgi:hypothetical protein